jgi:hypothetical protein
MYRIIGADGKEYGPVTAEQVRQWLAEGRANGQTRIRAESSLEWKTVADFPEFGLTAQPPGPVPIPALPMGTTKPAEDAVAGPAVGLIVTAILGFFAHVLSMVYNAAFASMAVKQTSNLPWASLMTGPAAIITGGLGIVTSIVVLFGAIKMKNLQNYGLSMTAAILAVVPCVSPCCMIGLPIGIWALIALSKPEVKSAFH